MTICKSYKFPLLGDERGSLIAMDKLSGVPFEIKRVYHIFGTKEGVARGFHAHKKLHQIAICVSGSCRMVLDDGEIRGGCRDQVSFCWDRYSSNVVARNV